MKVDSLLPTGNGESHIWGFNNAGDSALTVTPADLFGFVHGPSSRDFRVERKWRSSSRKNDECVQATERR